MNKLIKKAWGAKIYVLIVLPFFYFFVGAYFRNIIGNLSLRSVDPEYIYFISGLGISEGHLKIGHIDNPGTPLQMLIALVFRITYLFRPHQTPYIDDVFMNSDLYLSMANLAITFIVSSTMFLTGWYVMKKSKSLLYAVLIQMLPLLPIIWYDLIGRITPELLFPLPLFALSAFLVNFLNRETVEPARTDSLLLGIILAFGLSIKLTFISMCFIPFVILSPWKEKLKTIGFTVAFFFLFALPVTLQLNVFWHWVKNLFIHSGAYGGGDSNIVNLPVFVKNLNELIHTEHYFVLLFVTVLIISAIYLIKFREVFQNKKIRVAFALLLVIFIQFLLIGKQYAHRYFIPALMLTPMLVILLSEMLKDFSGKKIVSRIVSTGLIILIGWNFCHQFSYIRLKSEAIGGQVEARVQTSHIVSTLDENSIKIIVSQDYGCPFKEYALLYSTAWAANSLRPYYAEKLRNLYPDTYQYTTWDDKFQFWGESFSIERIIENNTPVYLYLEKDSEELYSRTIAKINPDNKFGVSKVRIYLSKANNEAIYCLSFQAN